MVPASRSSLYDEGQSFRGATFYLIDSFCSEVLWYVLRIQIDIPCLLSYYIYLLQNNVSHIQ
jgi:hypothetical protein